MSLPSAWVDRVHARLLVRYGAAWIRKWEGVPMEAVKVDWADALTGLGADAIAHALDHLPPDAPPNALQFRDLCRSRPSAAPQLTHDQPAPNPERLAALRRQLAALNAPKNPTEMVQRVFARLHIAQDTGTDPETGRSVSTAQLDFLRRAERGLGAPSVQELGDFRPIPLDALPPGMRSDR